MSVWLILLSGAPAAEPPDDSSTCRVCCCSSAAGLTSASHAGPAGLAARNSPERSEERGRTPATGRCEEFCRKILFSSSSIINNLNNSGHTPFKLYKKKKKKGDSDFWRLFCQRCVVPSEDTVGLPHAAIICHLHVGPKQHAVNRPCNSKVIRLKHTHTHT